MVNYVKTGSVEELVEKLRNGPSISKETVIADCGSYVSHINVCADADIISSSGKKERGFRTCRNFQYYVSKVSPIYIAH